MADVLLNGSAPEAGFFYRGVANASYDLSSTLARYAKKQNRQASVDLTIYENELLTEFSGRAHAFGYSRKQGVGRLIALAQHHRLPTRFLDVTSSALIGLHFALDGAEDSAAVWRLDANRLQKHFEARFRMGSNPLHVDHIDALDEQRRHGPINVSQILEHYSRDNGGTKFDYAALVELPALHQRISSQRAAFVVWTRPSETLETFLRESGAGELLTKYEIPGPSIPAMRGELRHLGVTDGLVWPDMEGAARDATNAVAHRHAPERVDLLVPNPK